MFDLDFGKLIIVGVMALVFIGPKELPRVLRQIGQAYGKMQRMAAEFKGQLMEAINEADVEGLRKDLAEVTDSAKLDFDLKAKKFDLDEFAENQISNSSQNIDGSKLITSDENASNTGVVPIKKVRKPRSAKTVVKSAPQIAQKADRPKPQRKARAPVKNPAAKNLATQELSAQDHEA